MRQGFQTRRQSKLQYVELFLVKTKQCLINYCFQEGSVPELPCKFNSYHIVIYLLLIIWKI